MLVLLLPSGGKKDTSTGLIGGLPAVPMVRLAILHNWRSVLCGLNLLVIGETLLRMQSNKASHRTPIRFQLRELMVADVQDTKS